MTLSGAALIAIAKYLQLLKPVVIWILKRLPIIGPIITLIVMFHDDLILLLSPYLIPLNGTLAVSLIFASNNEKGQNRVGGLTTGNLAAIWILISTILFVAFGIFSNSYSSADTGTSALTQANMIIIVFFIFLFQFVIAIGIRRKQGDVFTRLTKLRWPFYFMYVVLSLMLWAYHALRELRLDFSGLRPLYFLVLSSPLMGIYVFSHIYILSIKSAMALADEGNA